MIAPVCPAGLPRCSLLLLTLLLTYYSGGSALITYDRHTLLSLRPPYTYGSHFHGSDLWGNIGDTTLPWTDHLSGTYCRPLPPSRRRRYRKRGKQSGVRVRIKAYLQAHFVAGFDVEVDAFCLPSTFWEQFTLRLFRHRWIRHVESQACPANPVVYSPARCWIRAPNGLLPAVTRRL